MKIDLIGYEIREKIYESQRSLICKAIRKKDQLPVIIKALNKDYPSVEEVSRFEEEIRIVKKLNFPGVIKNLELVKYKNKYLGIYKDIDGKELNTIYPRGMDLNEFLDLSLKIIKVLGDIHSKQIIHRDINPKNIIYNSITKEVIIIDFGIAIEIEPEIQLINMNSVLEGSLPYISPEQTGRINRSLDYRTDYYSLGITLFELLIGQRPFDAQDNMDWIHCHIAKQPQNPSNIKNNIPNVLSKVILKLISKNPDDRYQTAYGLISDLQECKNQLNYNNEIADFTLGTKDKLEKLQVPNKIYGREKEQKYLLDKLSNVLNAKKEFVLLSGNEGIGKSVLAKELQKFVIKYNGFYAYGKANEFSENIPYSVIASALKQLVETLLIESEEKLAWWRDKINSALGPNGKLITNIVPELEKIIGVQESLKDCNPDQEKNRFYFTCLDFIKVFALKEHPLVIFLDNLHLCDIYSLQLILNIYDAEEIDSLLILGAYRDNELTKNHYLYKYLRNKKINKLKLEVLTDKTINTMLSDIMNCDENYTKSLTDAIFQKTEGNPYSVNELIKK
ncbi:AAA family ATPase, partial [Candidatus Margulisiibacteriota bacterium]